jgi:aryl-alcohol dehydrogenase-like predicted oxidoreductase
MERRRIGRSEVFVTPITQGTWAIGGWMWGGTDEKKSIEAIQEAIAEGVTTIDTAPVYGMGLSESIVGKAVKGQRSSLVIATKCGLRWGKGKDPEITKNISAESIIFECEESLKRLQTEYIDLYQIHWPDSDHLLEESWEAMVKLKKQGKVRAIGVSNYSLDQLKKVHSIHPVDSFQNPYSLVRREMEKDFIPFCLENQISILAYTPLERGVLTGKYHDKSTLLKGDHRATKEIFEPGYLNKILKALDSLKPIAKKYNATFAQLIINCTISRKGITTALLGARNKDQAKENAAGARLNLSQEERETIVHAFEGKELQRAIYDSHVQTLKLKR